VTARTTRPLITTLLLALLAGQFALVQLATGAQYGDAPRNLHWGILTWEQPAFLAGAPDTYQLIEGFPASDAAPGSERPGAGQFQSLHSWWGPVVPLLLAAVWGATGSYTALQLVVPLAAGATVLLTYAVGCRALGRGPALAAAAFLALYPLFREYGTVAYTEALGALLLSGALFAYLFGRTAAAAGLGALAALAKLDLFALYIGVVAICALYDRLTGRRELPWRHHLVALAVPPALAAPWYWWHTLGGGQGAATGGFSPELFAFLFPQMVGLTFYLPWFLSAALLAVLAAIVAAGLRAGRVPRLMAVLLGSWLGLALLVLLVYCGTWGAGNSPRIFVPALPALALLVGAGFEALAPAWRRRAGLLLLVLFATINPYVIWYQAVNAGRPLRAAMPAFAALAEQERGFVLTPRYWETILYSRQRATWFEANPELRQLVLGDAAQFARYVEANPVRYVLLPAPALERPEERVSPAVRAYLDAGGRRVPLGEYTLWELGR
jgi:hypothetical protein